MDQKVTGWIDLILGKLTGWVDKGLEFFGLYTSKYSKWIVILAGLFLLTKMTKINLNLGGKK